jgi:hypothetical protein
MAQLVAHPPPERKVGRSRLSGLTLFLLCKFCKIHLKNDLTLKFTSLTLPNQLTTIYIWNQKSLLLIRLINVLGFVTIGSILKLN